MHGKDMDIRMSLNKRLLAVLAIVCLLVGVSYVGINGMTIPQETETENSLFSRKETIYFWYSDETLTDYINSAAVNFAEESGTRVIPVLKSGAEYLEEIHQASLDGEQIPDAYLISNDSLEKAYLAGLATQVQDEGAYCNSSVFPETALAAVTYQDQIVAYPYFYETSAYVYNRTYLEDYVRAQIQAEQDLIAGEEAQAETEADTGAENESESDEENAVEQEIPGEGAVDEELQAQVDARVLELLPETMDELLEFANNYETPENVDAVLRWDVSDIFYNYYFIGKYMIVGGESGDDISNIDIYNAETMDCLRVYQHLNQFFYIEPETVTYDSVMQEFMDGKVVFTVATTDIIRTLEEAKENEEFAYDYGVMMIPKISDELEGRSLSVTNAVAINSYSQHQEGANAFAQYLTCEYLDNLYARTGRMPASYRADLDYDYQMVFMQEYRESIPIPKMMETSNFWVQLEVVFSKIWGGEDVNTLVRGLSETIMTQITGEAFTEEYIEDPVEEVIEEGEYIDDTSPSE